jgi:hypothetical protein
MSYVAHLLEPQREVSSASTYRKEGIEGDRADGFKEDQCRFRRPVVLY